MLADACATFLGGKGFNQAVAARRMGANVSLAGRLGDDGFAAGFHAAFAREGIDAGAVTVDRDAGTGIAVPLIEPDGSNSIVVAPRANMRLTPADVERAASRIEASALLLLQLEVPTEASSAAARIARRAGALVILNPAPALPLPDELLRLTDILTPNEVEAAALTRLSIDGIEAAFAGADRLRERGARTVVITLGAMGMIAVDDNVRLHLAAHRVDVVDTTAAGDAFSGAMAAALAASMTLQDALRLANAAGARAVTRLGAEPSLPRRAEVESLLSDAPAPNGSGLPTV